MHNALDAVIPPEEYDLPDQANPSRLKGLMTIESAEFRLLYDLYLACHAVLSQEARPVPREAARRTEALTRYYRADGMA